MSGCSITEKEWVVFYETVRFLGQLSHSPRGSGFLPPLSKMQKLFPFLKSFLQLSVLILCHFIHSRAITSDETLKTRSVWGQMESWGGKVEATAGVESVCGGMSASWLWCSWLFKVVSAFYCSLWCRKAEAGCHICIMQAWHNKKRILERCRCLLKFSSFCSVWWNSLLSSCTQIYAKQWKISSKFRKN